METNLRSITKSITWRITGTIDTFIISWILTGTPVIALGIAGTEVLTKVLLYWIHERAWNMSSWETK